MYKKPCRTDTRLTYDVPEAGRLLGLSRNAAYAAANSGQMPVLEIGGRKLVPKAALHRMLAGTGTNWDRPLSLRASQPRILTRDSTASSEPEGGSET